MKQSCQPPNPEASNNTKHHPPHSPSCFHLTLPLPSPIKNHRNHHHWSPLSLSLWLPHLELSIQDGRRHADGGEERHQQREPRRQQPGALVEAHGSAVPEAQQWEALSLGGGRAQWGISLGFQKTKLMFIIVHPKVLEQQEATKPTYLALHMSV